MDLRPRAFLCAVLLCCIFPFGLDAARPLYLQGDPSGGALEKESAYDSLRIQIQQLEKDTDRIDALNGFASAHIDVDHVLSLQAANQALGMAQAANYEKGERYAHFHLAQVYSNYTQEYDKAIFHLTEVLSQRSTSALEPHFELMALKLLGFVHRRLGNNELAKQNYQEAIAIAEANGFRSDYSDLNSYMGDLLEYEGKTDQALAYYEKILDLESKYDFQNSTSGSLLAIARYFELKGQLEKASSYYQDASRQFEREGNLRWASYALAVDAELKLGRGRVDEALATAFQGLEMARTHNLTKELADNHEILSNAYQAKGDYERALYHFKALTAINDSIYTIARTREIAGVVAEYEQQMRDNELARALKAEEENATRTQVVAYLAILGIFLTGAMALFLYRGYRQKQRVNAQLEDRVELKDLALSEIVQQLKSEIKQHQETQAKLESSSKELNHFIYKSSHDLKGPLASIMGLADIARSTTDPSERRTYLELIAASSKRLGKRLDALIHASILTDKELEFRKVSPKALIETILEDFSKEDFAKGVEVQLQCPRQLHVRTDEYLLRTICGNLVENAMRYKNVDSVPSQVKIKVEKKTDGLLVQVSDNGRGIEEGLRSQVFEMFTKSDLEFTNSGLGLYLVKRAVNRLGGKIDLESKPGHGTKAAVFLPLYVSR